MRTVKFIRSLNIEAARLIDDREMAMEYRRAVPVPAVADKTGMKYLLAENDIIDQVIVPVHHLCRSATLDSEPVVDEMFIAYSEEVADLLGLPVKLLTDKVKDQKNRINFLLQAAKETDEMYFVVSESLEKYREASFWQRLKYLFTRSL